MNLAGLIRNLRAVPGVQGAVAFDAQGAVAAQSLPANFASLATESVGIRLRALLEAHAPLLNSVRFAIIRYTEAQLVAAVVQGSLVVMAVDPGTALGSIRVGFRTAIELLRDVPARPAGGGTKPAAPSTAVPPKTRLGIWD